MKWNRAGIRSRGLVVFTCFGLQHGTREPRAVQRAQVGECRVECQWHIVQQCRAILGLYGPARGWEMGTRCSPAARRIRHGM